MIGIFTGQQASGKTLAMSYFAYDYFLKGYTVHCNYNLSFKFNPLTAKDIIDYTTGAVQFERAVFCLDEIHNIFDSRNFGKKSNKIFSYFLTQTSKRDVVLLGTTQVLQQVELRFRQNCDFQCFCQRELLIPNTKPQQYIILHDMRRKLPSEMDEFLYIKMNFYVRHIIGLDNFVNDLKIHHLKAKPIYPIYNTRQLFTIDIGDK